MNLDYELNLHYEPNRDDVITHSGYTITFFTQKVIDRVYEEVKLQVHSNTLYRFTSGELYDIFNKGFGLEFSFTLGSDSWPLYAMMHKDYWEGIFGEGYIEKTYPLRGRDLWNSAEDLEVLWRIKKSYRNIRNLKSIV